MCKLKISLLLIVFITASLAAAWGQSCSIGAYGYVTDPEGNPVVNATVEADTSGTTTDTSGYYSVSRVQINCNSMYVRVEATGYETATKYTPSGAGSYRIDFTLNPGNTGTATPIPTETSIPTPVPTCPCKKGDVNCDGQISIIDALMIAQYVVGLSPGNFTLCAADMSDPCIYLICLFKVDIVDALMVARYAVGLTTNF